MHQRGRHILRSRLWVILLLAFVLGLMSVTAARGDAGTQAGPNNGGQEGSGVLSEAGPRTVILENGSAGAGPGAPLAPVCSSPNVAIPDNDPNGVSDALIVAESGTILDMNVAVTASHPWVGDLIFSLKHESTGTVITLMDRPGVPTSTFGCSGDNVDAEFDDEGLEGPVEDMCATDPAIYGLPVPAQPLSAFDGENLSGNWTLTASDNAGGDTGTLVDWCLLPETAGDLGLVLDDGTAENAIGLTEGGQLVWLNRFTPNPAAFPFTLTGIGIMFRSGDGVSTGETFDLYVYTDADGDPANGATHVASSTNKSVQILDAFFTYPVNVPLTGPGDVLIAVVNRTAGTDPGEFPAAIDQTVSQGRSWVGFYDGNPADPPILPATTFGVIDDFGFPGNWMIRGVGVETGHAYLPVVVGAATTIAPVEGVALAPIAPAAALLAPLAVVFIARHTRRYS